MQEDPYDRQRFVNAQQSSHERALREIRSGRKKSHWMWDEFPQLRGLGVSATAWRYGISGVGEARAYLAHQILGPALVELSEAVPGMKN